MDWLRDQLAGAEANRKFVITYHIYPGARYFGKLDEMMVSEDQAQYYSIIMEFHDKIVMEVSAHDHVADLRYHNN